MPSIERGITVSLPYTGGRPFLRRAVESVLGQTHGELALIVLNDGESPEPWDLLADIKDKRLVRFDLDSNRGRYFADAVVLAATEDQYFMIQDDRDWSSAGRAALLFEVLREENTGAAFSAISEHTAAAARKVSLRACTQAPAPRPVPVPHQAGLYRTRTLRAVGGCYGGFRSGYGTLVVALTSLTARLAYLDVPLYHRAAGQDDTESAAEAVRARLDNLYEAAYRGFCDYVSGHRSLDELRKLTSALAAANVTSPDARELGVQSARLRARLATRARPQDGRGRRRSPVPAARAVSGVMRSTLPGQADAPDISVVIPTRDDTAELPATIESFLEARSRDARLEFVIVDDASPAGVDPAAFEPLLGRRGQQASLTVLRPADHAGIPRARNMGARYARGGRLFITDAHVRVEPGWDALITEYGMAGRVLAATIVNDQTGAPGFGASLLMPTLTFRWNSETSGDLSAVQVAASAGMAIDRELYWSIGGFDPGMLMYGSNEAEFSTRAWLRGAEVLNLPSLIVRHRFRSAAELQERLNANLHFILHNRLRFALLYLPDDVALYVLRDMAAHYPGQVVARACSLVASSDVWRRRAMLRKRELFTFSWLTRKFGLEVRIAGAAAGYEMWSDRNGINPAPNVLPGTRPRIADAADAAR